MFSINGKKIDTQVYWEMDEWYEKIDQGPEFGECNRNRGFNNRIYQLFGQHKPLRILELGCGGGCVVEDFHNDGHISVGIDARPGYTLSKSHAWGRIPNNLFQCDIGQKFEIFENYSYFKFDLLHAWEVFEHINPADIPQLMENIKRHSSVGSYIITSIGHTKEAVHRCVNPRKWWLEQFASIGFHDVGLNFEQDVVRSLYNISDYFYLKNNK